MPELYANLILAAYYGKPEDIQQLLLRNADLGLYSTLPGNTVKVDAIKASLYSANRENLLVILKNCTLEQLWSTVPTDQRLANNSKPQTSFQMAEQFGQTTFLFDLIMRAIDFLDWNDIAKSHFLELAQIILNSAKNFSEDQIEQIAKSLRGSHRATVFLGLVSQNLLLPTKIFLQNGADVNTTYTGNKRESALQTLLSLPDMDTRILDLFTSYNVTFDYTPQGTKSPIEYCRNPTIREYFIKISNPDFQKSAIKNREMLELRNKEAARIAAAKHAKEAAAKQAAEVQAAAQRRECLYNVLSCGLHFFWKYKKSVRKNSLSKQEFKIPTAEPVSAKSETNDQIPSATVVSSLTLS